MRNEPPSSGEAVQALQAGPRCRSATVQLAGERGVAIVVAHPDDETIGIGGQLTRLPEALIVHVTDGAPSAEGEHAGTREAFVVRRRQEVEAAMALAHVTPDQLIAFDIVDQTAAFHIAAATRRLMAVISSHAVSTVLTHAYEGGHPDHDATRVAVHGTAALLTRIGATPPLVLEMPFYTERGGKFVVRRFADESPGATVELRLNDSDWHPKQRMLAAFVSQPSTPETSVSHSEWLRPAPVFGLSGAGAAAVLAGAIVGTRIASRRRR